MPPALEGASVGGSRWMDWTVRMLQSVSRMLMQVNTFLLFRRLKLKFVWQPVPSQHYGDQSIVYLYNIHIYIGAVTYCDTHCVTVFTDILI